MDKKRACESAGQCVLTRRRFVQLSALGALSSGGAVAEETTPTEKRIDSFKATKEAAGYIQKSEPSAQDCSTCHSFIDPDDCVLVEGPVNPLGWCNWYSD